MKLPYVRLTHTIYRRKTLKETQYIKDSFCTKSHTRFYISTLGSQVIPLAEIRRPATISCRLGGNLL